MSFNFVPPRGPIPDRRYDGERFVGLIRNIGEVSVEAGNVEAAYVNNPF
jgi:hypothetical protein